MSDELPARSLLAPIPGAAYALVVSRYNTEFTEALATHARAELAILDPAARVDRFDVPGAFEIPVVVEILAAKRRYSAIIALGLILRGATDHADLIAASITDALQQIALQHHTPVIHEVLLVGDREQARARCLEPDLNRGTEAARAAVGIAAAVHAASAIH